MPSHPRVPQDYAPTKGASYENSHRSHRLRRRAGLERHLPGSPDFQSDDLRQCRPGARRMRRRLSAEARGVVGNSAWGLSMDTSVTMSVSTWSSAPLPCPSSPSLGHAGLLQELDAPSSCRAPFIRAYDPRGALRAVVTVRSVE